MERRVLDTQFEVRSAPNGHKIIEGYAAKFDTYSENLGGFVEVIRAGAFKRALADDRIKGKYEHELTLARSGAGTLRVSEDATGLPYEIDINPRDSEAMNVLARVERGDVAHSSFAFSLPKNGDTWTETEQGFPLREINSVARLFDVSVVSDPAYEDTQASARALRSFAAAYGVEVPEAADDLLTMIRAAQPPPADEPPEPESRETPVTRLRLEKERLLARQRARHRLSA